MYIQHMQYNIGKSTRIPLEVRLFTRMPLKVPNLPNYPYVQKNTLYKVIIRSNLQALFTRIPSNTNRRSHHQHHLSSTSLFHYHHHHHLSSTVMIHHHHHLSSTTIISSSSLFHHHDPSSPSSLFHHHHIIIISLPCCHKVSLSRRATHSIDSLRKMGVVS